MLHVTLYAPQFSTSIKKITHYLHSPLQIYEHFNRFINILKHCRPRSLAAVSLQPRPRRFDRYSDREYIEISH